MKTVLAVRSMHGKSARLFYHAYDIADNKEKFKSAWHNWETPAANYLKKDLNTVLIYQDS